MTGWEKWLSHMSTIAVSASGVAYLWMKYGMANDDPFSIVNHPLQPAMLGVHLVSAPFVVFLSGVIVRSHILKKLRNGGRQGRRSGLASAIVLPVMILSGYALQVTSSPGLMQATLILHLSASFVFLVTYLAHQVVSLRLVQKRAAPMEPQTGIRRRTA